MTTTPSAPEGIGFGIDFGGTGMKAAPVDLATGELAAKRHRIDTPRPSTPDHVAEVACRLVSDHDWSGPVGICMPSVVVDGIVRSAANIDRSWVGVDAKSLFADALGRSVTVLNDADAAGVAEITWGAGRGRTGVVLCLTFGTGIGSGLFVDGTLVPNTEFGHCELDGSNAERHAAASARKRENLSWAEWSERVNRYLHHIVMLLSPELIILGGGASKQPQKWVPLLDPGCEVAVAQMANNAGIAGAAMFAPRSRS